MSGEKERLHAAVLVSPAAERRKARKARRQAAARLQAEQARVEREAAKALAERRSTTFLPAAGEAGQAALRSPRRLPGHQDTSATLAGAYPFMAEGGLGSDGVFVGQDLYSGGSFVYDPWVLYARGIITAPNLLLAVIGQNVCTVGASCPVFRRALGGYTCFVSMYHAWC